MALPKVESIGLTVLWDPENPIMEYIQPPVFRTNSPRMRYQLTFFYFSIVFIHGLQGHPYRTWTYPSLKAHSNDMPSKKQRERGIKRAVAYLKKKSKRNGSDSDSFQSANDETAISSNSETQQPVFWPYDLLPAACTEARILTWGYDTQVTKYYKEPTSKASVFILGKSLLWELARNRSIDRPILFVAHSLGGIITKQMLELSHDAEENLYRNIVVSTKAVVFLGTPHRGSKDMANLGDSVRKIASLLMMDTSPAMLDALGLRTSDLERCQDSFMRLWRHLDFRVKTFQEGRGLTAIDLGILNEKVVPDISSALGDPREHAEPLDANHMEMARMVGSGDPNYRKVAGELGLIYQSVLDEHITLLNDDKRTGATKRTYPTGHTQRQTRKTEDELVCLDSLHFPGLRGRQGLVAPPTDATCEWLETHETYEAWLQRTNVDSCKGMLWITGKPGSGKSTIMKTSLDLTNSAPRRPERIVVSFFFDAKGPALTRSMIGFLRSTTHQIISQNAHLRALFVHLFLEDGLHESVDAVQSPLKPQRAEPVVSWTKEQLQSFLYRIVRQISSVSFVMFVDALDECNSDDASEVAYFLRDLTHVAYISGTVLDICISSRTFGSITVENCARINMEQCNRQDIERCVQGMFATAGIAVNPPNPWNYLCSSIVDKSSGVFLWAKLVVETLRKEREAGMDADTLLVHLKKVPSQLEELFRDLLQVYSNSGPNERLIATKMFQWAIFSFRPLRLKHWHHILAFIKAAKTTRRTSLKDLGLSSIESGAAQGQAFHGNTGQNIRTSPAPLEDADDSLERQIRFISKGLIDVALRPASLQDLDPLKQPNESKSSLHAKAGSFSSEVGDTRVVELMHESVREFMLQKGGFALMDETLSTEVPLQSHIFISNMCLDYINIPELDQWIAAKARTWSLDVQWSEEFLRFKLDKLRPANMRTARPSGPDSRKQWEPYIRYAEKKSLRRRGSVSSFGSAASAEYDRKSTHESEFASYESSVSGDDTDEDISRTAFKAKFRSTISALVGEVSWLKDEKRFIKRLKADIRKREMLHEFQGQNRELPSLGTAGDRELEKQKIHANRSEIRIRESEKEGREAAAKLKWVELKREIRRRMRISEEPWLAEQSQRLEDLFPIHRREYVSRPTERLGFDISFHFYAKNMGFEHAYAATQLGADPGPIIDRLIASKARLWRRWVCLQEGALHPETTLVDFLMDQPKSYHTWMKVFVNTIPKRLTYFLVCLEMNAVAAHLAIRHDVEHALAHCEHPMILRGLFKNWNSGNWPKRSSKAKSEKIRDEFLETYLSNLHDLLIHEKITSRAWKSCIKKPDSDGKCLIDLAPRRGPWVSGLLLEIDTILIKSLRSPINPCLLGKIGEPHTLCKHDLSQKTQVHENAASFAVHSWGFWPAFVGLV